MTTMPTSCLWFGASLQESALYRAVSSSQSFLCIASFLCCYGCILALQSATRLVQLQEPSSWRGRSGCKRANSSTSQQHQSDDSEQGECQSHKEKKPAGFLTREMVEMMAGRKWRSVLEWITFHPDELRFVDKRRGHTALHLAVLFGAPSDVVEMMLLRVPSLASARNEEGEIPLHWAVRLRSAKEVLHLLLKANPTSGFFACDQNGGTPFSLLWERHRDELVQAYRQAGREELMSLPAWSQIMFFFLSYHCNRIHEEDEEFDLPGKDQMDTNDDKIRTTATHTTYRPVHVAAQCACPPDSFSLIVECYRNQLGDRDEKLRVPLAVACSQRVANRSRASPVLREDDNEHQRRTKVQILLSEYLPAVNMRNADGRIPLFIALASGMTWDEGVSALFAHTPKASSLRDEVTGLLPFALAAAAAAAKKDASPAVAAPADDDGSISRDNSPNDDGEENASCVSTIYQLLRADPLQIVRASSNTKELKHNIKRRRRRIAGMPRYNNRRSSRS